MLFNAPGGTCLEKSFLKYAPVNGHQYSAYFLSCRVSELESHQH